MAEHVFTSECADTPVLLNVTAAGSFTPIRRPLSLTGGRSLPSSSSSSSPDVIIPDSRFFGEKLRVGDETADADR